MISATAPRTVSARIRHLYLAIAFGLVIGMIPIGVGSGTAEAATAPSFRSSSASSGDAALAVVSLPAGVQPNDVLVAQITRDKDTAAVTPPAGWILIREDIFASKIVQALFYKVSGASEPADYTFALSESSKFSAALAAYSGVDTASPIDAHSGTDIPAGDPFSAPSITTTVSDVRLVAFFANLGPDPVTPATGMTERWDFGGDIAIASSDEAFAGPGATGDRTASFVDSEKMAQMVALAPLASASNVVIVNSTGDASDNNPGDDVCNTGGTVGADPECTLRAAIQESNGSATVDTIHFDIPTSDPGYSASPVAFTIEPASNLPAITTSMTIDGTTQPEYASSGRPVVEVTGSSAGTNADGFSVTGGSSTIRGLVVNNWDDEGFALSSAGNSLFGSYIGTDVTGSAAAPNKIGVVLRGTGNTIGGPGADGNLVSGNTNQGIMVTIGGSSTQIVGNLVGTDASGSGPVPNGRGIDLNSADDSFVGGTDPSLANTVAYNTSYGVAVTGSSDGNSILGNAIHSNSALGIDLNNDGVTGNDAGDGDTGQNDFMNYPVITSAVESGGNVTVTFDLDVPAGTYRVEFFDNTAADGSGYGEGETFLGSVDVSAGTGLTHVVPGASGDIITATATESLGGGNYGSTSEFSASFTATASAHSEPMAVWRRSGQSTPFSSGWDGSTFGGTQPSASVGDFRIVQGAESPTRDEAIVVGVDSGGTIAGEIWDGSSWAALPSLGTTSQTYWWSVDVAYEPVSGDAIVVYTDGSALNYRVWDGSTWSTEASITEPPGGTPRQMQLAAHPFSDEMVLIVSNDSSQDYAVVWDGSAWGNELTLDATGTGNDRTDVHVAYEQQSGRALVVWGSGNDDVHFRVWDAGWSNEFVTPGIGGGYARWITLGSDPAGDNIAMGVLTNDADVWVSVWNGAGWVNQSTVTTSTTGTTEPAVAVAFEGTSGQAIAAYGESVSTPRFRTWDSGTGWSAESSAPSIGATSNSMMLYPEPGTDGVMLAVQDTSSDLHYLYWDGTVWGSDNELETSTGETKNQPFLFLWNAASVGPMPPAAADDSASTPVDTAVVVDVLGNDTDPNGDTLTVQSVTQGSNGSVVNNGTDVTFTPNASWSGSDTFTYTASDGNGGTDTATVTVTVEPPGPVAVSFQDGTAGYSGTVDTWVSGSFADQDNSADPLIQIDNSAYQQGLIRFDGIVGPGAGQVPTDATILSAELTFVAADPSDASATLSVHRVLRTWVETDTWNTLSSGIGIDDSEASLASDSTLGSGLGLTDTPVTITGLESAVQAWVDGSANNGWLLVIDSSNGWDARSSENSTVNWRPKLDVTYAVGPLTLTVNSTSDSGDSNPGDAVCDTGFNNSQGDPQCTLRAAIEEANAFAGADNITFSMPATESGHSGGVWTISPGSAYPTITEAVSIDATTQTGYTSTPVVELDGTGAGAGSDGLRVFSPNVGIRGLAINRFGADGIEVDTTSTGGVVIAGNHIGLDPSGLIDRGNGGKGIDLQTGSGPTTVGGTVAADRNVISGNGLEGIIVWGTDGNTIIGNYIGTDVTGNAPIPNTNDGLHVGSGADNNIFGQAGAGNVISGNGNDGIEIDDVSGGNLIHGNTLGLGADGTTVVPNGRYGVVLYNGANATQIGGSGAGEGNVISGNGLHGVTLDGNSNAATTGNTIEGNLIGTDSTGLLDRGNGGAGIYFFGGVNNTTVGGATAGHRNVISGNTTDGIYLQDAGTTDTVIMGNYIGVDIPGNAALPNGDRGVQIESGANNTIVGGTAAGEGNVISANGNDGIIISDGASPGTGTTGTVIEGNLIGVGADGSTALGNGTNGVRVTTEDGHRIGGAAAGAGNTIAYNGGRGVDIQNASASANPILGNSIYSNTNIGIDLGDDGLTTNDAGDGDSGANGLLNFPVITSATESGGTVTVEFDLDVPAGNYRVEFFTNPSGADGTGYGEGETFVSAVVVTAGSALSHTFAGAPGDVITATATHDLGGGSYGDTSEFSAAYTVSDGSLTVNSTGDTADAIPGNGACDTGGTVGAAPECTLRAAIQEANASANVDSIGFAIPDSDAGYQNLGAGGSYWRIQPATSLPAITDDAVVLDATTQTTYATGQGYLINDLGPEVELVGTTAGGIGLQVSASTVEIRGFVVNRFATGVAITGGSASTIAGNYIGTAADGVTGAVGNTTQGVLIDQSPNNVIGGTAGADRNVISGNRQRGIAVDDWSDGAAVTSGGTQIINNYIGVDRTGFATVPYDGVPQYQQIGIYLLNTSGTIIGTPATGNVISGNPWYGIYVWGPDGTGNVIQNNIIGLDRAESGSIPNGTESTTRSGVYLSNTAGNLVGGAGAGEGNTIATNGYFGVVVHGASAADNAILGNTIYGNGDLGIELNLDGVTANDVGDADTGPNDLLNYPEITTAYETGGTVTVEFNLDVPAGNYRVEFFTNPSGADGSGNGEGESLVSSVVVTAGTGLSHTFSGAEGDVITATATHDLGGGSYGDTSEFSAAFTVVGVVPIANDDSATTAEDTAVIIDVVANDTDPNGDTLMVDTLGTASNGSVVDNGDGTVTYTPNLNFNGSDSFTYSATDGTNTSNNATVTVTVSAVNDAPVANDDSATTDEDTAVVIDLLANDTDVEGDTLSFVSVSNGANGSVVDNGDGTVTYTPNADWFGSDSFVYSVTDGADNSNIATVTVTVNPVNDDPPVAVGDSATTAEDTPVAIDLVANDTDPDGDSLLVGSIIQPANGTVVDNGDGTVTYTPDADYNGTESFTYTATDGTNSSNSATVWVTVTPVNDTPVAVDDSASTAEDTAVIVSVLANDTDVDGDTLSIESFTQPTNGTVTDNGDGTLTYTPDANYSGSDSFTYVASDGTVTSNSATVTMTVNAVNDVPVAADDSVTTPEDTALVVAPLANDSDPEGDTLSIDSFTQPTNGTVTDNGDGTLTYTPDAEYFGSDSFTYVATDGTDASNTATVTVTVTSVNDAPVAVDDSATTAEDTAVVIVLLANDTDIEDDSLSIQGIGQPSNGTVVDNGDGTVTYTPDANFSGSDPFTYSITDGTDPSNVATVSVTVSPVNDAPVAIDDAATTPEDTPVVVVVLANDNDADGDTLSIDSFSQPTNGTVTDNGDGTLTYTPAADLFGSDSFTYVATDGVATSNTATVSVTVTPVSDVPVAVADSVTTPEDTPVVVALLANDMDADGDTLSIDSFTQPTNGTVTDNGDGTLTYTPNADYSGSDTFTYVATDGANPSNTATVSVTVSPVADAPVAVDDSVTSDEDTAVVVSVLANDTDADGDTLSIDSFTQPANGTVTDNGDGTLTYTPAANFNGPDAFTYVATDGTATSNTATVTVTVTAVNDVPVANDDSATTDEDTAVVIDVVANDIDTEGDTLLVDSFTQGANGTVSDNGDGSVTYTPDADFNGTDSFTYTATDGTATSNTATVTVTINALNDPPVAGADSATTDEDTAVVIDVLTNDTDADGDTLSVIAITQGSNGTVADNGDGTVTYSPDPDFNGSDSFTYTVSDGNGGDMLSPPVSVTVTPVNDAPVANDDAGFTSEDTPAVIDLVGNDVDVDGDTLTVVGLSNGANGSVSDNGDGTVTYTPNADFNGTDTFTYSVSDGTVNSNAATVTVTVNSVNDAPVAAGDTATTDEDTAVVIDLVANDTDADGDSLVVDVFTQGSNGTVSDNGDGTVTYIPNADFNGLDTFSYSATDGTDTSNTVNVVVTVNAVNDAPVANDDASTTDEDTAVVIDLLANDTDTEGDTLSIVSVSNGGNGAVVDNGDGTVTYTPNADFNGTDSFVYSVTDGTDNSNIATVTVAVNPLPDAPVAVEDTASTPEDTSVIIDVVANDTDGDGDTLVVGTLGAASSGTVVDNGDGTVTYTPAADFVGTATFTYSATDGAFTSNTATIIVTVTAVNDAPVAVDDAASTAEDTAVTIGVLANDTDIDGDPLSIDSFTQGANGTVTDNGDGTVTYAPDLDFNGTDSFTYVATDGTLTSNTATVTLSVTSVADAPVANPDTASTSEDTAVVIDVVGNDTDVDGDLDPTTTSVTAAPSNGSAAPGPFPGSITYTPDLDFNGSDSFTYEICDASALCDTAVVSVTVTAANDAPVASDDSVSTLEDTAVVVSVLTNDTDVDGDPLSIDSFTQGANGAVTDNGDGTLTYTPDLDSNGTDTFTYIATDGALVSNSATVTVTVGVVNDAPVAVDDAAATSEDTAVTFDVVGNDTDVDGDPLSVATVGAAANGTVSDNGDGTLTYTPDADFNGIDSFTYTVIDGTDTSNTASVTVTVTAVNDAPVAADDTGTTAEDAAITIDLLGNDSDVDGDPLSVATVGAAANGSVVDNGDGTVTYTPDADFNGSDGFTYTASDGTTTSNTATVTVTVTAVNDAPVAADDTLTTAEDTAVTVDLVGNDSDADGDPLSIATVGAAGNGSVVDNGDGTVTYTPNLDFNGVDSFTYTVTDGTDTSNAATVTATVTAVNDVPVAGDDAVVTDEDIAVTFDFVGNDVDADGDPLSIDSWSPAANGTVTDNGDGTFTYTPAVDFNGTDSFTYTVTDGAATSNVATVTVTVNAVNDAPVAIDDTAATSSDRTVNVDVVANDIDLDGDLLTVVGVGAATGGTATDNGDGTIGFNPNTSFSGEATFTYTVSDGALTDTALVTVSVTLANTPPVVSDVIGSIPETTSSGDPIGNVIATDPDGDGMVYTVSGDARIRVDGSGRLTLVGVVSAGDLLLGTVTVTDANGASTTASIAITVTAVNQAPVISDQAFAVDSDTATGSGVGSISASDPDGGSLTYSAIGSSPFAVDASGRVSVAGALDSYSGDTVTFSVIVTNSDGLSAAATITVTVRGVTPTNTTAAPSTTAPPTDPTTAENRPPVAGDDVVIGSEDSPKQFNPLSNDTDADGDPLTLTWIQTPSEGAIRRSSGYEFVPAPDWSGTTTAQYRISDGRGGSDIGTVTFVINPVNDAPRIQTTTEPATVSSGGSVEIPIPRIVDPENDGYTISLGDPEHGTAEIVDGKIIYTPDPGYEGQDTIQLFVVDTAGAGSRGLVIIEVVIDGATISVKILDLGEIGTDPNSNGGLLAGGPGGRGDGGEQFVLFGIPFFGLIASEVLSATWAVRAPLIAFVVVAALTLLATTRRSFNLAVKPLPVARSSDLTWSVVLVGEFERLPALSGPDHSHKAISWFDAGVTGIESTGKLMMTNGTLWVEVVTSAGPAWVEARHVTPGRSEAGGTSRSSMIEVRDEVYGMIRHGEPYTHLISGRGLYMQMSDEIASVPQSRVEPLLTHILRDGDAESKQLLDALSMPVVKDTDYEVPIELRNFEYLIVGEGWNRWALYFERGTDKRPVLVGVSPARALVGA